MSATIPHRELRNRSGEILRQAEKGQLFTVTVDGRPVAMLGPYPRRQWVPRSELLALLSSGTADPDFFRDIAELGTADDLDDPWDR
jgi:prevent-host-death family protein